MIAVNIQKFKSPIFFPLLFLFQFVAGFGRGGTSLPFWENVLGFDMSSVGNELVKDASQFPIVDVVNESDIVTSTATLQVSFGFSITGCLFAVLSFVMSL